MSTLPEKIIRTPIYIYQMGKVGSTTVARTLREHTKCAVIQAHSLNRMLHKDRLFLEFRARLRLPIKVICPIRDPISRNVSAFFQNFKRDTGYKPTHRKWTVDELRDLFLKNYPHNESVDWFDLHFRPVFGLDVYRETFAITQRFRLYTIASAKILVYRTDIDHAAQLNLISEFVERPLGPWIYANRAKEKIYNDLYRNFCSKARLPDSYLTMMHESTYATHFWGPLELEACAARWRSANPDSQ